MVKTLFSEVKEYKASSFLSMLFAFLEVLVDTLIPLQMARIIDFGISAGNFNQVLYHGSWMLVLVLAGLLFGILAGKFSAKASTGFAYNLRDSMFSNIQTFSFGNIDKFSTGGLITRLTTDVTNIQNAYQMVIRICVRAPMNGICAIIMALIISPKITMVFLVAIAFLGCILFAIIHKVKPIFEKVFKTYDGLNECAQENITGVRVVKSYVREGYETNKFSKIAGKLASLSINAEKILAFNMPAVILTTNGCILGISWFGAKLVTTNELTTGEMTSLFAYIMTILMSLMMISMIFVMLSMSIASGERICKVLEEKSFISNPDNPVKTVPDGSIDFENVTFAYSHSLSLLESPEEFRAKHHWEKENISKDVLSDINIHINSGETIGIVGGTGSGKTTFVNLISRLYDVKSGAVKVGGIDVRNYDIEVLRNSVSVVLQKNLLFSGSILENLRWGNEDATEEECREACKTACADEFIEKFPDKYKTFIEQGGTNVSGGQRQRLCIARALLKKPRILILDDSTSAVDTATDSKIRKAFRENIPDTTKLIIAQRINSVKDADRIIVLENGMITGFGPHEELVKTNSFYKAMYENQTQNNDDFDIGE